VAIAIAVWLTCASFLIHGKSISFSLSKRISSISDKHVMTTGTRRWDGLNHLGSFGLIHPQIRAEWVPHYLTCGPPNTIVILAITAMLVSDIALLLIMLIGLLRLRHPAEGCLILDGCSGNR